MKKTYNFKNGNGKLEIENEKLFIFGDIVSDESEKYYNEDATCPTDVANFLSTLKNKEELEVHINSGGGSVFAGLAIYHQLKSMKARKKIFIDGICASIATVIACACDEVIIPKNSFFMIHKPLNYYYLETHNADELRKQADLLDKLQENILDIYMTRTQESVKKDTIRKMIDEETWLNGNDCVKYFNFLLSENQEINACSSNFYEKYKNFKNTKLYNKAKELGKNKNLTAEDVKKIINDVENEKRKSKILKDLEKYKK